MITAAIVLSLLALIFGQEPEARNLPYATGRLPLPANYQAPHPNYATGLVVPPNYQPAPYVTQADLANGQAAQTQSAVDASRAQIAAAIAQGANPNNFGIQTAAKYTIATQPNVQDPDAFTQLDNLRGRAALTIDEILNILSVAVAGKDYPILNDIPATDFDCTKTHQAGFYADINAGCQVIRRCDINGIEWSYLCPNMTLFNQVTLVCDWFFNVNCQISRKFYDYSNPRLYTQFPLLDTPRNTYVRPAAAYVAPGNTAAYAAPIAPGTIYRSSL